MSQFNRLVNQLAALAFLGSLASSAAAETFEVPSEYSTIQAAVDAASDGDRVRVRGGTYEEDVVITKRLRLVGRSSPTLLGTIDVQADRVTVKGFSVEATSEFSDYAIRLAGDDGRFARNEVNFIGDDGNSILVTGDGNRVDENDVIGAGNAIMVFGDENEILENETYRSYFTGLDIEGNYNRIEDNLTYDNRRGATVGGEGNLVIDNAALSNDLGFSISGVGHLLQGNDAEGSFEAGFIVSGDDCVFNDLNQSVDNATGFLILSIATGNVFDDNEADDNTQQGWAIGGVGNTFTNNGADNNKELGMEELATASGNAYSDNSCKDNDGGASSPANLCIDPND